MLTDLGHIGESTDNSSDQSEDIYRSGSQSEDIYGCESQSEDNYGSESQSEDICDIQSKNGHSSPSEENIMQLTMTGLNSFDLTHGSQQTIVTPDSDSCVRHHTRGSRGNCARRPLQGLVVI